MDRRILLSSGLVMLGSQLLPSAARAQDDDQRGDEHDDHHDEDHRDDEHDDRNRMPPPDHGARYRPAPTYGEDELVNRVSDFFGVTAESAGAVIEHAFRDNGQPTGYIAGTEGSGAFVAGLRYGRGLLYMKEFERKTVYWQGPSIGWDFGGNASRVFTLCYNLQFPDMIYRRFPGVEGSAYLVAGLGVNYQRAEDITLAPIRAGVGLRLGANVGYLSYSRERHIAPF
ncbi:MAG TPA: DUF1134 domain-containing protein [Caulobacteraceae bacterium]|nr:DUF1134 domain-containing protein [Caulobacteraceae bacterium]